MITVSKFKLHQVIVLGLGRSGYHAMYSLINGGARVIVIDDKIRDIEDIADPLQKSFVTNSISTMKLVLNPDITQLNFKQVRAVVVSPGIPLTPPHWVIVEARKHNIPITSDIELLYETCNQATFIAITGTNGKSTTTALLGHILQESKKRTQVGGNIGIGALKLESLSEDGIYVLETSSFQLDLLNNVKFDIAILLNLTPDHLDRHGDFKAYQDAKLKIFAHQTQDDYAIVSVDEQHMQNIFKDLAINGKQKLIPISVGEIYPSGVSVVNDVIYDYIDPSTPLEILLPELKRLPGIHNRQNIAAAYTAASIIGMTPEKIIKAIQSFPGLEHRLELVLEKGKLQFINDSKATNTDATEKALNSYDNIYWIAGGISKDQGIACLSNLFYKLKHVYLIGQAAAKFATVLDQYQVPYTHSHTIEIALENIRQAEILEAGVVLLSPACSSLDQWKDYEHRGRTFKELVVKMWN